MNDTVIKVENLSKSYLIGHQSQEKYLALRDVIAGKAKTLGKRVMHPFKSSTGGLITADETEEFWALKNINFEVKRGDRVGIIGRNGAGKSTLLKILSRITEPTSGRIEIDGRVASLLEVGTGFHPELTGRENIYLNGAILGMSRVDIKRKFDEIVAFAEVEKFLDTPVKRYSSGMYVRLAFAVAAHLEPEILIVDEVLAVGDAQFQKKCLGKMEEVGKEGRTILFVSHNMGAVTTLCSKAVLLKMGQVEMVGDTSEVVNNYFLSLPKSDLKLDQRDDRAGSGKIIYKGVCITDADGGAVDSLFSGEKYTIRLEYSAKNNVSRVIFKISVYATADSMLLHFDSSLTNDPFDISKGNGTVTCTLDKFGLSEGNYRINIGIVNDEEVFDHVVSAFHFSVVGGDYFKKGRSLKHMKETCFHSHQWEMQ